MLELVERAARQLDRLAPPDAIVLLAVSGGPDSVAMLDLLSRSASNHRRRLAVGHVDHGINPDSSKVAAQVASLAQATGLPYFQRQLSLGSSASETVARRARRGALRSMAAEAGAAAVALAHHRDDQAETVLLRVLTGSGPSGLAGMAARRGLWIRPLLRCSRQELLEHLEVVDLSPWQDPANSDPKHLRSWLRIAALPLLQQRFEGLTDGLLSVAEQAGQNRVAWNEVPELLQGLDLRWEGGAISVAAPLLQGYRSAVQDAVLAALARRFGVPLGANRRAAVRRLLSGGRSGARVALGKALEAELTFDRLTLRRPVQAIVGVDLPRCGRVEVGRAVFAVREVAASGGVTRVGWSSEVVQRDYRIRSWQHGDRIRPLGGTGSRAVAEVFKEARVAAGARRGWPVMVLADDDATVVWVPGICRSDACIPVTGEEALHVECDLA